MFTWYVVTTDKPFVLFYSGAFTPGTNPVSTAFYFIAQV